MEDCVKRIVELCEQKGISRSELCRRIDIPPTTLSNYIVRGGQPSHSTLKKIAAYFGVSMEYIDTGIKPTLNLQKETAELVARIGALPEEKQKLVLSLMYNVLSAYEL